MRAAIATHWLCLTCGESGTYDEPDTKTDTGAAEKHLSTSKHAGCVGATISATNPAVLEYVREQTANLAAARLALAAARDVREARKAGP